MYNFHKEREQVNSIGVFEITPYGKVEIFACKEIGNNYFNMGEEYEYITAKFYDPKYSYMNFACVEKGEYGYQFHPCDPYIDYNDENMKEDRIESFTKAHLDEDNFDILIKALNEGYCDAFQMQGVFGRKLVPVKFLDSKIGEELRQKSIEGYTDVKFVKRIRVSAGFSNGFELDKDFMPLEFDIEEDAQKYIDKEFNRIYGEYEKEYPDEFEKDKNDYYKARKIVTSISSKNIKGE